MNAFPWRIFPVFHLRVVPRALLEVPTVPWPDPPFTPAHVRSRRRAAERWLADPRATETGRGGGRTQVDMSLVNVGVKEVGGRVTRVNVSRKLKTAISLVVTRGADVEVREDGRSEIVFRDEELGGENWILSGACSFLSPSCVSCSPWSPSPPFSSYVFQFLRLPSHRPLWETHTPLFSHITYAPADWTYIIRPQLELAHLPYTAIIPAVRTALAETVAAGRALEHKWFSATALTDRLRALQDVQPPPQPPLPSADDAVPPVDLWLDASTAQERRIRELRASRGAARERQREPREMRTMHRLRTLDMLLQPELPTASGEELLEDMLRRLRARAKVRRLLPWPCCAVCLAAADSLGLYAKCSCILLLLTRAHVRRVMQAERAKFRSSEAAAVKVIGRPKRNKGKAQPQPPPQPTSQSKPQSTSQSQSQQGNKRAPGKDKTSPVRTTAPFLYQHFLTTDASSKARDGS